MRVRMRWGLLCLAGWVLGSAVSLVAFGQFFLRGGAPVSNLVRFSDLSSLLLPLGLWLCLGTLSGRPGRWLRAALAVQMSSPLVGLALPPIQFSGRSRSLLPSGAARSILVSLGVNELRLLLSLVFFAMLAIGLLGLAWSAGDGPQWLRRLAQGTPEAPAAEPGDWTENDRALELPR